MTTRIYAASAGSSTPFLVFRRGEWFVFSGATLLPAVEVLASPPAPDESLRLRLPKLSIRVIGGIFGSGVAAAHMDHLKSLCLGGSDRLARVPAPLLAGVRRQLRDMAPLMAALRKAYQSPRSWNAVREALQEIQDNMPRDSRARGLIVAATERMSDDEGGSNYLVTCDCGHVEQRDDTSTLDNGDVWCQDCVDERAVMIDDELYDQNDVYQWESDGEWHTDPEPEDEDEDEDPSSDNVYSWGTSVDRHVQHDTSFTPSVHGDFTLGVEVEVESNSRDFSDAADDTLEALNEGDSYMILKEDGSLSSAGFEIVTSAQRLGVHIEKFAGWVPHDSLRAWNPGTCGVHVHIDSRAFSALTLGKFLMFVNDYRNEGLIRAIAGRHPRDGGKAQSYCAAMDQTVLDTPAKALKGGPSQSRYRMVNLCNLDLAESRRLQVDHNRDSKGSYSTVELRIFRASLKKERLLAQIEFAHAAVMFCRVSSWHSLDGPAFKTWLAACAGQYKHLARWFGVTIPKANKKFTVRKPVSADETV